MGFLFDTKGGERIMQDCPGMAILHHVPQLDARFFEGARRWSMRLVTRFLKRYYMITHGQSTILSKSLGDNFAKRYSEAETGRCCVTNCNVVHQFAIKHTITPLSSSSDFTSPAGNPLCS